MHQPRFTRQDYVDLLTAAIPIAAAERLRRGPPVVPASVAPTAANL